MCKVQDSEFQESTSFMFLTILTAMEIGFSDFHLFDLKIRVLSIGIQTTKSTSNAKFTRLFQNVMKDSFFADML